MEGWTALYSHLVAQSIYHSSEIIKLNLHACIPPGGGDVANPEQSESYSLKPNKYLIYPHPASYQTFSYFTDYKCCKYNITCLVTSNNHVSVENKKIRV